MGESTIGRDYILKKIVSISDLLEEKARNDHCIHDRKIRAFKAALYGYSVAVRALRDKELDELTGRIERIEEKIG